MQSGKHEREKEKPGKTPEHKVRIHNQNQLLKTQESVIKTSTHVLARAWYRIDQSKPKFVNVDGKLVVSKWIYPWEVDEFDRTIFQVLLSHAKYDCQFTYHDVSMDFEF